MIKIFKIFYKFSFHWINDIWLGLSKLFCACLFTISQSSFIYKVVFSKVFHSCVVDSYCVPALYNLDWSGNIFFASIPHVLAKGNVALRSGPSVCFTLINCMVDRKLSMIKSSFQIYNLCNKEKFIYFLLRLF